MIKSAAFSSFADTGFLFNVPPPCYSGPPATLLVVVKEGTTIGAMPATADDLDAVAAAFKSKAAELRATRQAAGG